MLILLAAMAAPAIQPLQMVKPVFREQWITSADYPAAARRFGQQGTVGFRLKVNEQGWPVDCTITQPSQSQVLNEETCRLLRLRARFEPARDAGGKPVPSTYDSRMAWRMPAASMTLPGPGMIVTTVSLSNEGKIENCTIDTYGAAPKGAGSRVCQSLAMPFQAAFLKQHAPGYGTVRFVTSISVGAAAFPMDTKEWGALLLKSGLELEVDKQGRPMRCTALPSVGQQPAGDACAMIRRQIVLPAQGEKPDRLFRFENAVFGRPR